MNVKDILNKIWSVVTWPIRWVVRVLRGVIWSARSHTMRYRLTPELNQISNRHIDRVVGSYGILTRDFKRRIRRSNPNRNPMGEEETRALILSLLKRAVAEREQISGMVAKSAEIGAMYNSYYGKLQRINELEIEDSKCRKALQAAKSEYEFAKRTYETVRDYTYTVKVDGENLGNQTGGDAV